MTEIIWKDLSKYGDLIPINEFKQHMKDNFLIPGYDGSGVYASSTQKTNIYVPEDYEDLDTLNYTHVEWYNN